MKKFDRITAIFILLQSRKTIKAQEIADRFEVTLRTVYRDIRTLQNAGVPIIGEAGIGYSLIDGYRLPPIQFTQEEATAFLLAEKFVGKHTDPSTQTHFEAAMDKVKAVLRTSQKESFELLSEHIEVANPPSAFTESISKQHLPRILEAIKQSTVLELHYKKEFNTEVSKRQIEPLGIYFRSDNWHLLAYCRLRKDYRDFRIDRMVQVKPTMHSFEKHDLTVKAYLSQWWQAQTMTKIQVAFSPTAAPFAQTQKYYYGLIDQKVEGERIIMTFLNPNLKGVARWLLIFSNQIEILSPPELRVEMQKLVKELQAHY